MQDALDGMKKAIMEIPDPVTKIATVSTLGQIGGGDMGAGYPGDQACWIRSSPADSIQSSCIESNMI